MCVCVSACVCVCVCLCVCGGGGGVSFIQRFKLQAPQELPVHASFSRRGLDVDALSISRLSTVST